FSETTDNAHSVREETSERQNRRDVAGCPRRGRLRRIVARPLEKLTALRLEGLSVGAESRNRTGDNGSFSPSWPSSADILKCPQTASQRRFRFCEIPPTPADVCHFPRDRHTFGTHREPLLGPSRRHDEAAGVQFRTP